jgi:hypothetical protein
METNMYKIFKYATFTLDKKEFYKTPLEKAYEKTEYETYPEALEAKIKLGVKYKVELDERV